MPNSQMDKKVIILFGPPGSGKGTQADLLSKHFNLYHLISSKVGKERIENSVSEEDLKQKEYYNTGGLFDPEWIFKIIKDKSLEILKNSEFKGMVYDGSPRTLFEAEKLYSFLIELVPQENIKIIQIETSLEELKLRLQKRLVCDKNSAHVFIASDKNISGMICPNGDKGTLLKRDIDDPKIFEVRISEYEKRTFPGIDFLNNKHEILKIDGNKSIKEVFNEIVGKMGQK